MRTNRQHVTAAASAVLAGLLAAALVGGPVPIAAASGGAEGLNPALQPIGFLVGDWASDAGKGENGMTLAGTSSIRPEVGGAVLVRRDHTTMTGADGKPAGGFDQLMPIYAEGGTLRADYFDGRHTIHYASATVDPGRSVTFATAAGSPGPAFHLTYAVAGRDGLTVTFEMAAPGGTAFHAVANGQLHRRA